MAASFLAEAQNHPFLFLSPHGSVFGGQVSSERAVEIRSRIGSANAARSSPRSNRTVCDRMSAVVAGSGSGAHDDFPGHGAKTAFGLPIRQRASGAGLDRGRRGIDRTCARTAPQTSRSAPGGASEGAGCGTRTGFASLGLASARRAPAVRALPADERGREQPRRPGREPPPRARRRAAWAGECAEVGNKRTRRTGKQRRSSVGRPNALLPLATMRSPLPGSAEPFLPIRLTHTN